MQDSREGSNILPSLALSSRGEGEARIFVVTLNSDQQAVAAGSLDVSEVLGVHPVPLSYVRVSCPRIKELKTGGRQGKSFYTSALEQPGHPNTSDRNPSQPDSHVEHDSRLLDDPVLARARPSLDNQAWR